MLYISKKIEDKKNLSDADLSGGQHERNKAVIRYLSHLINGLKTSLKVQS